MDYNCKKNMEELEKLLESATNAQKIGLLYYFIGYNHDSISDEVLKDCKRFLK